MPAKKASLSAMLNPSVMSRFCSLPPSAVPPTPANSLLRRPVAGLGDVVALRYSRAPAAIGPLLVDSGFPLPFPTRARRERPTPAAIARGPCESYPWRRFAARGGARSACNGRFSSKRRQFIAEAKRARSWRSPAPSPSSSGSPAGLPGDRGTAFQHHRCQPLAAEIKEGTEQGHRSAKLESSRGRLTR